MAETIDLDQKRAAERRLALLALAGEQPVPPSLCLDAEQLACLVEGRLAAENVESCLAHLAACEQCYATWRQLDQEWQQRVKNNRPGKLLKWFNRPRLLATTGSILAIAASITVFLNITMQTDRESILRLPPQPAQEQQKQIAPSSEPKIEHPLSLEQKASPAPPPQQLEKQREKKAQSRTTPVQAKEQEAVAPTKALTLEADRTTAARKAPAAAVGAAPPIQAETASADKLTENKGKTSGQVAKEAAPSPAPTQQAARAAGDQSANTTGAEPLTLAEWQRMIREGCQGQPGPVFFATITAQGRQLLARKDAIRGTANRRQVSRALNMLTAQHQQPATQQCRALLELLGPIAEEDKE